MHGPNYPQPLPDIIKGEPEYKVKTILGSWKIGRQKELQYKICWKGYSAAHDSWEPANQIHAPELIKKYQMETLKRRIHNASNLKSTSAKSTATTETKSDKRNIPTTRPKTKCPTKDKKERDKGRISINSYTMSSPINQAFNNIIQLTEATKNKTNSPEQPPIDVDEGTTQVESSGSSSSRSTSNYEPTPEVLLTQALIQNPTVLTMATVLFEYQHARETNQLPPVSPTNSQTSSPTTTDNLHPRHPYKKHTDLNTDLSNQRYECPYLAAIINPIDGDPRIISKADQEGPAYNKGRLTAQPVNDVDEDIKDGTGGNYAIGGDTYLDSQFLYALRSLAN